MRETVASSIQADHVSEGGTCIIRTGVIIGGFFLSLCCVIFLCVVVSCDHGLDYGDVFVGEQQHL